MEDQLRADVRELPRRPGVYLFKNPAGEVLYVGKAISLRDRVRSYFGSDLAESRGPGMVSMVQQAERLDHLETGSELEALLLEARLIRQYKPKYNIKLRDDKSFSLIRIDFSQEYPPISLSREKDLEEILQRKNKERTSITKVSQRIDKQEFFGPYLSAYSVREALKTIRQIWPFRDCGPAKYKTYEKLGHGCIFATLGVCDAPCAANTTPEEYRKNIEQIRIFLRGDRVSLITQIKTQMEEAALAENYEMAARYRNRLQALVRLQNVADSRRFSAAQQKGTSHQYEPESDLKIECYDISNISGAYAVGSLIVGVVKQGKVEVVVDREAARRRFFLDRSSYRRFRIKTVEGISDFDMLREVLTRRLKRAHTGDPRWKLPDLIMVDGGKGHLQVSLDLRKELGLIDGYAAASVAKGPTRKKVDLYGADWDRMPMIQNQAVWQLIAELLREEAHRFAITYYRSLHRKQLTGKDA